MTSKEDKRQYRAYRRTAKLLYENAGMVDTKHITVTDSCTVQRLQDGAFVEMYVWIPKEAIQQSTLNKLQQEELERIGQRSM